MTVRDNAPVLVPAWVDRQAYPFAVHALDVPAGRLSYVDEGPRDGGGAEPVLLVHGTPTWSFEYRHVIPVLAARRRTIAVDHLGFGLSARPAEFDYRPESHARNLEAFADALGLRRFAMVVHDFGGPIALPLALAGRVSRLVVLNSWMWSFEDDGKMRRRAQLAAGPVGRWLYRWANASLRIIAPSAWGDRKKLTRAIHEQYLAPFRDRDGRERVLWALARALLGSSAHYRALWDARERLRDVPTLVLWGLRDSALPPEQLARWREALPHAAVLALEEAGHWPHEEAPEEVAGAIARFLDADATAAPSAGLAPHHVEQRADAKTSDRPVRLETRRVTP